MTLEELQKLKEQEDAKSLNNTLTRGAAGLASSLLSWGATPDIANKNDANTANYLKSTEPAPVKELKAIDVGGKPYLVNPEAAQYHEAYVKPSASANGSFASKLLKNIDPKSPDFGKVTMGFQKGLGFVDGDSNPIPSSYVEWKGEKTATHGTASGGKVTYGMDPYSNKVVAKITTKGLGDVMGEDGQPLLKEEGQARIKSAAKGKDLVAKNDVEISSINNAISQIGNTKDPMVFSLVTGNIMRNSLGEKRLSDEEGRKFMGDDYKGFYEKGKEYLISKYGGEIPNSVRANVMAMARYALDKETVNKKANSSTYAGTKGLGPKGKSAVENTSGVEAPAQQSQSSDYKSYLLGL